MPSCLTVVGYTAVGSTTPWSLQVPAELCNLYAASGCSTFSSSTPHILGDKGVCCPPDKSHCKRKRIISAAQQAELRPLGDQQYAQMLRSLTFLSQETIRREQCSQPSRRMRPLLATAILKMLIPLPRSQQAMADLLTISLNPAFPIAGEL